MNITKEGRFVMHSHEALKRTVGGFYREIAKRLGLSKETVYKWTESTEDFSSSGAYNPVDRVEAMIDEAQRLGVKSVDGMAPILYLATAFGVVFLPPVKRSENNADISRQLCKTMKEVSESFAVSAAALEDDLLTPQERKEMLAAAYEGLHELTALIAMIQDKDSK
jgi:AcrR family transcriptional regulator